MRKKLLSFIIIIFMTVALSSLSDVRPDNFFISTIFTVSGIMFSIGLGLITTFNLNGVKNRNYIKTIRANINTVRNSFICYFLITTICYVLDQYISFNDITIFQSKYVICIFNFPILFCLFMFYAVCYFIVNFLEIQKLNNDIFDKVNEENENN